MDKVTLQNVMTGIAGVAAVVLFVVAVRDDSSKGIANLQAQVGVQFSALKENVDNKFSTLERKVDELTYKAGEKERAEQALLRRMTMELWIERARQVPSLKELPPLPN